MPMNRYHIRNVHSMADPELYKAADKDDPEPLLEGVAMAGLVGLLRQLGDLAEFATEIFHDLHEEVMATAARGHALLLRVQQLESEIPPIERAFLSQTSQSAFFSSSGIDWHPNRHATQNLISTGDLPRFVMDSYEECRGPPQLFLLDKFDVGGAGACIKRYTDPSIFRVEVSSYEIENAKIQRDKKIRQTKRKGSRLDKGETPKVSQPSHAKLHQLFLEERVQTGVTEAACHVKLRKMPKKFPFDTESGESYMNKLFNTPSPAHEVAPILCNGSRLEDSSITDSPMQNTNPYVSSRKVAESQPSYADLELDNQIMVDAEIHTDGLQNGCPSACVASETDNYMDVFARLESEVETSITHGTYSDANKHQLQSQLSDSQPIENSTAYDEGSNLITKGMTVFVNSDTKSTSAENTFPVGADSPPRPFASIEIPFRPRAPFIADNISVTQNLGHDITNDTSVDVSKVSIVDHVASLEQGTSDSNEVCSNHTEKLDGPRKSELQIDKKDTARCTSECSDILPIADGLSSFSYVRNLKGDLDNKYPNDRSIPMILLPNILDTTKDQVKYDEENHSTDSVVSSSQSVISCVYELSRGTTYDADIPVTEGVPEGQLKQKDDMLMTFDQSETAVSYANGRDTESDNIEIESVTVADGSPHESIDYSVIKEGKSIESEEREIEFTYSDVKRDDGRGLEDDTRLECIEAGLVNSDMETSNPVLLPLDVGKHEETGHSVSEQDSTESRKKEEVNELLVNSQDGLDNIDVDRQSLNSKIMQNQNHSFLMDAVLPNMGSQPVANDLESKSTNHIYILEAAVSSPLADNIDQSNNQLHMQLPVEAAQLGSLTQVDHEKHNDNHLQDLQSSSESYSVLVSEKTPTMESSSHDIFCDQDDIIAPCHSESNVVANTDHDLESKSINHGDHVNVFDVPAQPSPLEDKVDEHSSQLHAQIQGLQCFPDSYSVLASENPPTVELRSHDINLFDQGKHQSHPLLYGFGMLPQLGPVKAEDSPPLPPLPPMQWRMGKLQNSSSAPTNGGQHSNNHIPPFFPSTSTESLQLVGHLTVDETINLNNKNQEPHTQHNEVKFAETMVPQRAVETHQMPTSYQEVFWPSLSPYPHPPVLDEMQYNRPMKMQRPCSPLIDAVASHDKTKLRKVSDRDTAQIPKGEEKDTLLDQIRAKSINLRPTVHTKPSIQGPTTNLRVAAILEKANAIRQAFTGSDDDDSDNWSDL